MSQSKDIFENPTKSGLLCRKWEKLKNYVLHMYAKFVQFAAVLINTFSLDSPKCSTTLSVTFLKGMPSSSAILV
jgi:hypothetical protein